MTCPICEKLGTSGLPEHWVHCKAYGVPVHMAHCVKCKYHRYGFSIDWCMYRKLREKAGVLIAGPIQTRAELLPPGNRNDEKQEIP